MHSKTRTPNPSLSKEAMELFTRYQQVLAAEDISQATLRNYLLDVRHFLAWCEQSWHHGTDKETLFSLSYITTPLIVDYRSFLQTVLQRKPAGINRVLASLRSFCKWAMEQGLLLRDPMLKVKQIGGDGKSPRKLTNQEVNALVAALEKEGNIRDQTLLITLLHTGLRSEELCSLKVSMLSIGMKSGRISLYGKGNDYGEIPLNPTARDTLTAYMKTLPSDAIYLFPSEGAAGYLTTRTLRNLVAHYAYIAKVEDVSPHDFRHYFCYRLAKKVSPMMLAKLMRHKRMETTMLYYDPTDEDKQQAIDSIAWQ